MAGPSGATARLALPYPIPTDTADVPRDVQALASALDPIVPSFLSGTYAARPAAAVAGRIYTATDTGGVYYDTGTKWATLTPPVVTALPTVGVADGDEVLYSVNPGIGTKAYWLCHYDISVADAYKWIVVSGPPLAARADASRSTAAAQAAYGALPTDPIQLNLTNNGIWDVELQANAWSNASGLVNIGYSCVINGVAASDAWAATVGAGIVLASAVATTRHTIDNVSDLRILERARASSTAGHTGTFSNRRIQATPVRLSA